MKIVKENLYEFERGIDPKAALGLGRVAKIEKLFRDLNVSDEDYEITPTGVMFHDYLNLGRTNVVWLPDNLKVTGWLDLENTPILKLPNGLIVGQGLNLCDTKITEIPNDFFIYEKITVSENNKTLIDFLKNSKWKSQYRTVEL